MVSLIRIEHTDGCGIFVTYDEKGNQRPHMNHAILDTICAKHYKFNNPHLDGLKNFTGNHFCGYKSMSDLYQWLNEKEIKFLLSIGFSIYLIEVSEALVGEFNVCYKKQHILLKKDISHFF